MANVLTDPPFVADPPVKLNVNARILGLVIGILAVIGALLSLFAGGLFSIFAFAGGFAPIWFLGVLIALVAEIMAAIGGFRMYNLDRGGKILVIYGLALALAGAVLNLVGQLVAYSGLFAIGYSAAGAVVGLIIDAIIYFCIYYLVVISRFPGEQPLVPGSMGGYQQPPPPPPPTV
jgi:MFS family permease